MKRKIFITAILLANTAFSGNEGVTAGNGTFDDTIQRYFPIPTGYIVDERTLLKEYLTSIKKVADLEARNEQARLDLIRELHLLKYPKKWWDTVENNRYWDQYFKGVEQAKEIMSKGAGPHSCKLLVASIPKPLPKEKEILKQAFHRGLVAAHPECFIENLKASLKSLNEEMKLVRRNLFLIEKKIRIHRPDEKELEKIYQSVRKDLLLSVDGPIQKILEDLKDSLEPDLQITKKIIAQVNVIKKRIQCKDGLYYDPRLKQKLSCHFKFLSAPHELDIAATYRILVGNESFGPYQPRLEASGIIQASKAYLSYPGRTEDQLVTGSLEQITKLLNKSDQISSLKIKNLRKRFNTDLSEELRSVQLGNLDIWRSYFSKTTTEAMIDRFFTLKQKFETYARLDVGTQVELDLLEKIGSTYQEALKTATGLSVQFKLPERELFVDLDDNAHTRIELDFDSPIIPAGYLMGLTLEEVEAWKQTLNLDPEWISSVQE